MSALCLGAAAVHLPIREARPQPMPGGRMKSVLFCLALALAGNAAAQSSIRGIVTNGKTAEAGVWVIAETDDLPTKFAKIVVTDDRGRYRHSRSAEGELPASGCAATAWSIRRR